MDNFQSITANAETLAAFLGSIPAIETPWDDAFHRIYCSSCSAEDCDDCRRPERIARYGGSASRRRRQRNERRFFPHLRGVRARRYGAVGERYSLLSVLCSRQMQGARRRRETL